MGGRRSFSSAILQPCGRTKGGSTQMHPLLFPEHEMRLCFADPLALGVAESWAKGRAWKGQRFLLHPGLQTGSSPHALLCSPADNPGDSAPAAITIGRQQILGPWVAVWSTVCCHHGQLPGAAETHRQHTSSGQLEVSLVQKLGDGQ